MTAITDIVHVPDRDGLRQHWHIPLGRIWYNPDKYEDLVLVLVDWTRKNYLDDYFVGICLLDDKRALRTVGHFPRERQKELAEEFFGVLFMEQLL